MGAKRRHLAGYNKVLTKLKHEAKLVGVGKALARPYEIPVLVGMQNFVITSFTCLQML